MDLGQKIEVKQEKPQEEEKPKSSSSLDGQNSEKDSVESYSSQSGSEANDQNLPNMKNQENQKPNQQKKRYKYCCKKCKHTDKNKKACVCVVPLSQRRTLLGDKGCQTCGCEGCSREDYVSRGEDPEYMPGQKKKEKQVQFQARNGCCRKCMKAFSKSHKACLCQVPDSVRKGKLPSSGCKICGCRGCNPQDKKDVKDRKALRQKSRSKSRSRDRERKRKSRRKSHKRSSSRRSTEKIDPIALNFYNIDRSIVGNMIMQDYQLSPLLFGFGVPQRTQSYIIGRPK